MGAIARITLVLLWTVVTVSTTDTEKMDNADKTSLVDPGMMPLYDMSMFFINSMVHTGSSILDMEKRCGGDLATVDDVVDCMEDEWEEWVFYWMGFVVCAGVGIVLFIVMILVAICTPCCRCCGNCGGEISPIEPKDWKYQRVGCGISLFLVTGMLILGVICMFTINVRLNEKLHGNSSIFTDTAVVIKEAESFLGHSIDELDVVALEGYRETTKEVIDQLNLIPQEAMDTIDHGTHVMTNFEDFSDFVYDSLPDVKAQLAPALQHATSLEEKNTIFTEGLHNMTNDLIFEISNCTSAACNEASEALGTLTANANYSTIFVDLYSTFTLVEIIVNQSMLADAVTNITQQLDDVQDKIEEYVEHYVKEAEQAASELDTEIEDFIDEVRKELKDVDFDKIANDIRGVDDDMELPAFITYWTLFGLTMSLALICFCNLIGIFHDVICPQKEPKSGCCTPDKSMGARWLLAGVAFTFIFYWLYTLIVLILFVTGGLVESEGCKHIRKYEDDNSFKVLQMYERWSLEHVDIDISVMDAYRDCGKDMAIYTALQIEKSHNITEIIDLTPVEEIINDIKRIKFDLDEVEIMPNDLAENLFALDETLTLNYETYKYDLRQDIVNLDMNSLLSNLTNLAGEPDIDNSTLTEKVQGLKDFYSEHESSMSDTRVELSSALDSVQMLLTTISVNNLTLSLNASETDLNLYGEIIVGTFVNTTADEVYNIIKTFADDVDSDIRNEVGKCLPLHKSATSALDSACVESLWPINGLWFSLGWCLLFLIPSIILSFKLATLYRKTLSPGMESGFSSDTHPLYDAYRAPTTEVHPHGNPPVQMLALDNPVYNRDGDDLQFQLPRPQVINTKLPPMHVEPDYDVPKGRQSPPPKYDGAWTPSAH